MWTRDDTKATLTLVLAAVAIVSVTSLARTFMGDTGGDIVLGLISCGIILHLSVFSKLPRQ